jgi:hypothetical protein
VRRSAAAESEAIFSPLASLFVASFFFFRLRDDGRDRHARAFGINRNEGEKCGGDVLFRARHQIFHPDLDSHFHGSPECPVHTGSKTEKLADADGMNEIHVVYRSCYDGVTAVLHGRDGARKVHDVHDLATEQIAEEIGVVGQRKLGVFGDGILHESAFH